MAPSPALLKSCLCTQERLETPRFQDWTVRFQQRPGHMHRKIWEWCYIAEALSERGQLMEGQRGLGFAVGTEPLAAVFAREGATILATDLAVEQAVEEGWLKTNEHAADIEFLNQAGICPPEIFRERCQFRPADMTAIDDDLQGFDFVWSSCAFEHLGSLQAGVDFVMNAMDCIKPGGWAVHTTEYNVASLEDTLVDGGTVLYRRKDIEALVKDLRDAGHHVDLDLSMGSLPKDYWIDIPPYTHDPHLKLKMADYVITSFGLIIQKAA